MQAILAFVDADKNGTISLDEVQMKQRAFDQALEEAGGDEKQIEAVQARHLHTITLMDFLSFDTDDDHVLTAVELRCGQDRGGPKLSDKDWVVLAGLDWSMLREGLDTDADGALSKEELDGFLDDLYGAGSFSKADTSEDGVLSREEFVSLLVPLMKREWEAMLRSLEEGDAEFGTSSGVPAGTGR